MDSGTFWSNVDSLYGSMAFEPEELAGLTVQRHEDWEDEEDWDDDEDEEWGSVGVEGVTWGEEEEDFFDDWDD